MNQPILTIVVPCYNEAEVLRETKKQLTSKLIHLIEEELIAPQSKLLFVDDGSKDTTWSLIDEMNAESPFVTGLKLARNVGHQKALLAGLETARKKSDCVISIDADLQDDVSVIREFVEKYRAGYDIVFGVRKSRDKDTSFKKVTAQGFYRFMNRLGIDLVYNHADFRLMSKRALTELARYGEKNLFIRGIIPLIGLRTTKVLYDRKERLAGESKYPLKKMISFAFDGITSFSVVPIRMITIIGFISFFISSLAGIYVLAVKFLGQPNEGWSSLMVSLWFIGGLLLMSMGLIGEYIGKIYEETKHRPRFIIETDLYSNQMNQSVLESMAFNSWKRADDEILFYSFFNSRMY
ncbi:glycosyltransferase involved in cell wall biosynthesis [Scopulibacillus darangshiensis]|uniref:Glycosyltransferase involved in cell wall biosynthesis n=1 Tax=Scopulibacillus darangshiensis TaxID=442528 RepID=A0A4R2NTQ3_9BACL|nr:glycosyltransferase family 2 protein [Scopulibacillus darangshiensis]TCP24838.1 glycosyltransferase involved in cell wall biosynthesis [Scopulibacillus darangshiensis]